MGALQALHISAQKDGSSTVSSLIPGVTLRNEQGQTIVLPIDGAETLVVPGGSFLLLADFVRQGGGGGSAEVCDPKRPRPPVRNLIPIFRRDAEDQGRQVRGVYFRSYGRAAASIAGVLGRHHKVAMPITAKTPAMRMAIS